MLIRVNGRDEDCPTGCTLDLLLRRLDLDGPGRAAAVGTTVVPRSQWPARVLAEGEQVTVIRAAQGG
jgi:sulfur carrier protein